MHMTLHVMTAHKHPMVSHWCLQTTTSEAAAAIQETLGALQAEHTALTEEMAAMEVGVEHLYDSLKCRQCSNADCWRELEGASNSMIKTIYVGIPAESAL